MRRRRLALASTAVGVVLTAGLAMVAGDPGVGQTPREAEPGVTQLLWERGFRHPVLIPSPEGLRAFFVRPPAPATDGGASEVPYMHLPGIEWPLYYAEARDAASLPVAAQPALRLPLGYPNMSHERLCMCAFSGRVIVASPKHHTEVFANNDALILDLVRDAALGKWSLDPLSAIPHSLVGAERLYPDAQSRPEISKWFMWYTKPYLDCERLSMAAGGKAGGPQRLYLCGEDHLAETIWCTSSEDAKAWRDPVVVARLKGYPAIAARAGYVLVAYTDTGRFSYQNLWPDDLSGTREFDFWAGSGSLKCRLSMDGGKTWDDERTIAGADQAVSSALTWADNGMLWLVYVKSLTQREATALCIMRSSDAGKTWTEPQQITSGKWVDRDPCIIIHEGHPVVAFSRCRAPQKETSIWLWEGKRGGF